MINRLTVLLFLAILLGGTRVAPAQQRPLVTEDPETVGPGRVLLEGGVSFERNQENNANGLTGDISRIGAFGVSIGAGSVAEIQVDGTLLESLNVDAVAFNVPPATATPLLVGDTATGFGDLFVATKLRLAAETESRPAFGVRLGTKLPFADPDKGVGLGTTDFFASFLLAKTVQSVRTVGNVGLVFLGNPRDAQDMSTALSFGVSIARAVTNAFEVVGELNGRLDPFEDVVPPGLESRAVLRLAGRYTYAMLRLDGGIVLGFTDRDPSFGIIGGVTYVIAP